MREAERTTEPQEVTDLFAQLAIWRAQDFGTTDQFTALIERASQDSDNWAPTLTKSSYGLPATATNTADEQQRSRSNPANEPGRASNTGLSADPSSGLQA